MIDFEDDEETNAIAQAYCAACRDVVTVIDGACTTCEEDGVISAGEAVLHEGVPPGSPRALECPTCGADPGTFCYPHEEGNGYNHEARVDAVNDSDAIEIKLPSPRRCKGRR